MLQWRPRLFVLVAVLALLSIAVVGGWGDVLNLYWRLLPDFQGRGLAVELGRRALETARSIDSERPVVARMLADNVASSKVAARLGMVRRPDLDATVDGAHWILYSDERPAA